MLSNDESLVDTRIVNEAASLSEAGYAVSLFLPARPAERREESVGGFRVHYVPPALHSRRAMLKVLATRSWRKAFRLVSDEYERQLARETPTPGPSTSSDAPGTPASPARPADAASPRPPKSGALRFKRVVTKVFEERLVRYGLLLQEAAFAREVRAARPDIIHVHDLPMLRLGRQLAEESGASLVYDAHEFFPFQVGMKPSARFWYERERADIRAPDIIITVNQYLADEIRKFYGVGDIRVIYNTAPFEDHTARRESGRARLAERVSLPREGGCVLLYLGYVAEQRGAFELIEALSLLPENYVLAVLGDGDVRERLEERINQLKLGQRVAFLGLVPREQVPALVVGADIGLVTQKPVAVNETNCSPNRLSDYLMGGLPLALSDLPFLRWFVETYECGALFDPRDPRSMAQAIRGMFDDSERFAALRRKALEAARQFNWDIEGQKFLELYAGLN
ncbi:MAG: glycosyltransferase [Acidobacteriota bacterium]|nr:glycosyltransferase [Acidobacteriota bacterium]MDQ5835167.1 glycosyltransferase [Acidobacteriota bacterium]